MPKGYWIASYKKINDPAKLQAYAALAAPAIKSGGGRFLARGTAVHAYEQGILERSVLIEFDSVEQAVDTYGSEAYRGALDALGDGADRDIRMVPGTD